MSTYVLPAGKKVTELPLSQSLTTMTYAGNLPPNRGHTRALVQTSKEN